MGIIYSPNSGQLYYGISTEGSFFENKNGETLNLKVKKGETDDIIAIASKNHLSSKTETWLADRKIKNIISASSSIKFCALPKVMLTFILGFHLQWNGIRQQEMQFLQEQEE